MEVEHKIEEQLREDVVKRSRASLRRGKLSEWQKHIRQAEEKLARYQRLTAAMDRMELTDELLAECKELAKLADENNRLLYRTNILNRSIEEQEKLNALKSSQSGPSGPLKKAANAANGDAPPEKKLKKNGDERSKKYSYVEVKEYGNSIIGMLKEVFGNAMNKAYPEFADVAVVVSEATLAKFGDYQFNSAMALSQKLGQAGKKTSPRDVATEILKNFQKNEWIDKLEIAGPGYINVFLNRKTIAASVVHIATEGVSVPRIAKRKVVVDFSSPNIAKEMHVGHLRSTIIGDSISRLFEYVGFEVLRINHIGDWGTQFGMLIAHLQDRFPNFLVETPPISDLQAFYKESKVRFDEDAEFKARAYQCVVKLQSFDVDIVKAWQMICDVSRRDFSRIYKRLDVTITERGESFYQMMMVDVVKDLDDQGVLKLDEGRKLMFPTGCQVPLTVVKSDGGYTYDTSDLAAIRHRLFVDRADWLIYVVDAGQNLHFETIFAAARDLNWYSPEEKRVEHVEFGLVLGEDKKKFKTRSGDTVRLTDLLDEGMKRAAAKLQEKERDKVMSKEELESAQEAIAYGCIKYTDLSQTRTQDYVFSFDKMLDDRGNTAVYLLYAYARIRSICRNTGVATEELLKYARELPEGELPLSHESEFRLAKTILKFSDCVLTVLNSLMLHQLCDYVYTLATTFHDFYTECYVIQVDRDDSEKKTLHMHRLLLCEVTANVMAQCFKILGLRTVERM